MKRIADMPIHLEVELAHKAYHVARLILQSPAHRPLSSSASMIRSCQARASAFFGHYDRAMDSTQCPLPRCMRPSRAGSVSAFHRGCISKTEAALRCAETSSVDCIVEVPARTSPRFLTGILLLRKDTRCSAHSVQSFNLMHAGSV